MTRFVQGLLFIVLVLAPVAAFAGASEDANAVVDRWSATYTANDAPALVKLYTPDAILLGTVSPIISEGSAPITAYFARLPGSGNKNAVVERRTMVLGPEAMLVTGFYDFTAIRDGNPVVTPARFSMVVVKRGDDWLIAHHHSSRRPEPPK
ncbi:MAG TPA: SgcJ/EcaC family oxidoreductase [Stellaceae bacterium]|nr:SgcJ/EcaC family oxidoreductase [Stellaceae bacterium]